MASTVIVAQAQQPADALQQGVVVEDHAAPAEVTGTETHAVEKVVFPPFNPSTFASQLLWLAITFGVLYWMISRVAAPRIGGILEQRRVRLEGDLKEADRLRLETDKAIASYEAELAAARQRAHGIAEETRHSIKADIDNKRAVVETDLSRKLSDAEASISATKTAALANVEEIAADTAAALVSALSDKVTPTAALEAVREVAKE